jgi:hypothetical protein
MPNGAEYDPLQDRHLRHYFRRPKVHRHVTQSVVQGIVAAEERDPWTVALRRLGTSQFRVHSPERDVVLKHMCGCKATQSCAFCDCDLSRDAVLSKAKVRHALQTAATAAERQAAPPAAAAPRAASAATYRRPVSARRTAPLKPSNSLYVADNLTKNNALRHDALGDTTIRAFTPAVPAAVPRRTSPRASQRPYPPLSPRSAKSARKPSPPKNASLVKPPPRRRYRKMSPPVQPLWTPVSFSVLEVNTTQGLEGRNETPIAQEEEEEEADPVIDEDAVIEAPAAPPEVPDVVTMATGRQYRAARTVQAWIRGTLTRDWLKNRRRAVCAIQAQFRAFLRRRCMERVAKKCQAAGRGLRMRLRLRFLQQRLRLWSQAELFFACNWKQCIRDLAFKQNAFIEQGFVLTDEAHARRELWREAGAVGERTLQAVLRAKEQAYRERIVDCCDADFASVLHRKRVIQSVSQELLLVERQEESNRVALARAVSRELIRCHQAAQRFAVEDVQYANARRQVVHSELTDRATLLEAAACGLARLVPLRWARESESLFRAALVAGMAPVLRLHRDEYARIRLAYSEAERRKLIAAVEASELGALRRHLRPM